jgi:DNA repair protein RadA/Sms
MYSCIECGYQSLKWLGKCPQCDKWDTFAQEQKTLETKSGVHKEKIPPKPLKEIKEADYKRIPTKIGELDRVLGGGLVPGEIILVGGEPGVGKSTLLLEVAAKLSDVDKTLYVSAEESPQQVALRASRLNLEGEKLYILGEDNLSQVAEYINENGYKFIIIDSIQVVYCPSIEGPRGSVSQIKGSADFLTQLAKALNIVIFVVGHVTKEGAIAGPKLLEHIVDCVLYFEGELVSGFRILRAIKNRFGATGNLAVFEMSSEGLKEITETNAIFLPHRDQSIAGSAIACVIEGIRPMLIEIQALTARATFGMVRRKADGFDFNRFSLLSAVVEKRLKCSMADQDVFVNVVGGIKIDDPGADLALIMAIASSLKDKAINSTVFMAEVGLAGELRRVHNINARLKEAERSGFKRAVIAEANLKEVDSAFKKLRIDGFDTLHDLAKDIL